MLAERAEGMGVVLMLLLVLVLLPPPPLLPVLCSELTRWLAERAESMGAVLTLLLLLLCRTPGADVFSRRCLLQSVHPVVCGAS